MDEFDQAADLAGEGLVGMSRGMEVTIGTQDLSQNHRITLVRSGTALTMTIPVAVDCLARDDVELIVLI